MLIYYLYFTLYLFSFTIFNAVADAIDFYKFLNGNMLIWHFFKFCWIVFLLLAGMFLQSIIMQEENFYHFMGITGTIFLLRWGIFELLLRYMKKISRKSI